MPKTVIVFLRQSVELKAAAAACRDKPKPKRVHKVRSATRRLEATLDLLATATNVSGLRKQSASLRRSLRKIRRSAGEVRDLDVLGDLIVKYKDHDREPIRRSLKAARNKAAEELQRRLEKDQHKLQRALDELETTLAPALDTTLGGKELAETARRMLAEEIQHLDARDDEQLHTIRKASKKSRYVAEIGAETSKQAAAAATHFERSQQTLGAWHDHLLLLAKARQTLGKKSGLIRLIDIDTKRLRKRAVVNAQGLLKRV